ncbi:MAG: cobalamin-dependent protein [Acidobacteria bacterium]|nr:cobalamin-dependent protein [Acidobacteriota bacterium]
MLFVIRFNVIEDWIMKKASSFGTRDPDAADSVIPHPLGGQAKILLTSVFGPYARDDGFGSRAVNPMELYHNQVTRFQGPFSLRMFHRSWGLMFIQANISAPCILLDFPTLDRFVEEIRSRRYDIIGISSISMNILKVRHMCCLIRKYQPEAAVVVGGHIAGIEDLADRVDADWVVKGEGVRWFRRYLGEDPRRPLRHPVIPTRIGTRSFGIEVRDKKSEVALTVIPSVGCPLGCNFCSTSSMFGGKGRHVDFYRSGDELFDILKQLEGRTGTCSFFIMDENFLLYRARTLRLLELMQKHGKAWTFYVFSSANAVQSYSYEELVSLGISWIWMGLEGESSRYGKLQGIPTRRLVRELQAHGIRILGSTIIGLEDHTPDNIDDAIEYAVGHGTDFHQFMLYMPLPGTPLFRELTGKGVMLDENRLPLPDWHGQYRFNYRHPHIPPGLETVLLERAFRRDFEVNGPSLLRVARTTLAGWKRYRGHPDPRIRRRYRQEIRGMAPAFSAAAAASARYYKSDPVRREKISALLEDMKREFGLRSRLYAALGGRYVHGKILEEERRLAAGWTYEPPTFYEANEAAAAGTDIPQCPFVTPAGLSVPRPEGAGCFGEIPAAGFQED